MTEQLDEGAARERLERERARVGELIAELRSEGLDEEQAAQSGDLTHYDQHPADQGSELFEREKDLAILEGLEVDLAEIEAALQRLDEGTYGVDEVTGDPIDPERLDALPAARTNIRPRPGRVNTALGRDRPAAAVRDRARSRGPQPRRVRPRDGRTRSSSSSPPRSIATANRSRACWPPRGSGSTATNRRRTARPRCSRTTRSQCCRRSAAGAGTLLTCSVSVS